MKNSIIYCIIFLCFFSCRNSYKDYIHSKDKKNRITVIQYDKGGLQGIYLVLGDCKEDTPQKDYVFLKYSDFAIYFKWKNDTLYLRSPGWEIIEKNIVSPKFNFSQDFTREELTRFGYYTSKYGPRAKEDEELFCKNRLKEYQSFTRYDLTTNWSLWWK